MTEPVIITIEKNKQIFPHQSMFQWMHRQWIERINLT